MPFSANIKPLPESGEVTEEQLADYLEALVTCLREVGQRYNTMQFELVEIKQDFLAIGRVIRRAMGDVV